MENYLILFLIYLLVINFYAVVITVSDKKLAKSGAMRVPEKKLFITVALGGSLGMYITMRKIRHKTLHKRFMIGIPLIMAAQCVLIIFVLMKLYSSS